jgi:type 1 glutamine amidotransferase
MIRNVAKLMAPLVMFGLVGAAHGAGPATATAEPIRVAVLTGDEPRAAEAWATAFERKLQDKKELELILLPDAALTHGAAGGFGVLLAPTESKTSLNKAACDALAASLRQGTGLLLFGHAVAPGPEWADWGALVGAKIDASVPPSACGVRIVDTGHPITAGVRGDFTKCGLCTPPSRLNAGSHVVLATAPPRVKSNASARPLAWTTRYAGGRVFVSALGREATAFDDGEFVQLVRNAIRWAAGRTGVPTVASEWEREQGFVPLFDGKTLTGWKYDKRYWSVQDCQIVGKSPPGLEKNSFAISERAFGDFVLRFSVKVINRNSGVQFRSEALPEYEVAGYQADAVVGGWGNLHEQNGRGRLVNGWKGKAEHSVNPKDWVDMEVEARGRHIIIRTNGLVTADYTEQDASRPLKGIIALQLHRGEPMEVRFTNLRIREVAPNTKRGAASK